MYKRQVYNGYDEHMEEASATTPQSKEIQKNLAEMEAAGCKAVVMEVSSQGPVSYTHLDVYKRQEDTLAESMRAEPAS